MKRLLLLHFCFFTNPAAAVRSQIGGIYRSNMGSSEDILPTITRLVGSLVWVRRKNGSWWPGRILGPKELSGLHVASPKSGTAVKLLGREDASVDWYNIERSKRVKPFRCGEFDECIEKAKLIAGRSKKREKYARREDAILDALELERNVTDDHFSEVHFSPMYASGSLSTDVCRVSSIEGDGFSVDPLMNNGLMNFERIPSSVKSASLKRKRLEDGLPVNESNQKKRNRRRQLNQVLQSSVKLDAASANNKPSNESNEPIMESELLHPLHTRRPINLSVEFLNGFVSMDASYDGFDIDPNQASPNLFEHRHETLGIPSLHHHRCSNTSMYDEKLHPCYRIDNALRKGSLAYVESVSGVGSSLSYSLSRLSGVDSSNCLSNDIGDLSKFDYVPTPSAAESLPNFQPWSDCGIREDFFEKVESMMGLTSWVTEATPETSGYDISRDLDTFEATTASDALQSEPDALSSHILAKDKSDSFDASKGGTTLSRDLSKIEASMLFYFEQLRDQQVNTAGNGCADIVANESGICTMESTSPASVSKWKTKGRRKARFVKKELPPCPGYCELMLSTSASEKSLQEPSLSLTSPTNMLSVEKLPMWVEVPITSPGIATQGEQVPLVSLRSKVNGKAVVGYPLMVEKLASGISSPQALPLSESKAEEESIQPMKPTLMHPKGETIVGYPLVVENLASGISGPHALPLSECKAEEESIRPMKPALMHPNGKATVGYSLAAEKLASGISGPHALPLLEYKVEEDSIQPMKSTITHPDSVLIHSSVNMPRKFVPHVRSLGFTNQHKSRAAAKFTPTVRGKRPVRKVLLRKTSLEARKTRMLSSIDKESKRALQSTRPTTATTSTAALNMVSTPSVPCISVKLVFARLKEALYSRSDKSLEFHECGS